MPQHEKNSRTQQGSGENRRITIGGDVVNSVVVEGDNNNVIVNQSNQRPTIKLYTSPIMVGRPAKPPALLDRESERDTVQNALTSGELVEFYATEGFGKTALMRHLSALLQLPDGIVYLRVKNKSLEDLLQNLFKAFYQCNQNYKPSLVEYTRYFEKIHALIFLDDVTLTRDEIQNLSGYLPACVFIFSSSERRLWDQGDSIHLSGLPADAAVNLFQQKTSRTLSDEEKIVVAKICAALQNNPLHIIQAAAVGSGLKEYPSEDALYNQVLTSLPESEKKALALLAVIGSAPLPVEHIATILNEKNPQGVLDDLIQRGLVEAHSPRYSVAEGFGRYVSGTWDVSQWQDAILHYFVDWSSRPFSIDQVLDAADALFAVLGNAAAQERWREVLQIGRAIESALIFNGQWSMWARLLNLLLQACRALGDQFIEAWTLHQMGSRALCLKDAAQAKELLSRALEIRKAIGDKVGTKATQHNLNQLAGAPPSKPPGGHGGSPTGGRWIGPVIGTIVVVAALAAWLVPAPYNPIKPMFTPAPRVTPTWTPTRPMGPTFAATIPSSPIAPPPGAPSPTPVAPPPAPPTPTPIAPIPAPATIIVPPAIKPSATPTLMVPSSAILHVSTSNNTVSNWTKINSKLVFNNPLALVFAMPNYNPSGKGGVYDNHPVGVWYTGNQWAIFNQDLAAMPQCSAFNVLTLNASDNIFVHAATSSNIHKYWTGIDNALTNNNPNAIVFAMPNYNPSGKGGVYDNHPIGVWYTGSQWAIFNQDLAAMPEGAAFNVLVLNAGETAFVHAATSSNIHGDWTGIDSTLTNNNPNVIVFAMPNYNPSGKGGVYDNHPIGVWYTGTRWAVFNQDLVAMPKGAAFNILIAKSQSSQPCFPVPSDTPTISLK